MKFPGAWSFRGNVPEDKISSTDGRKLIMRTSISLRRIAAQTTRRFRILAFAAIMVPFAGQMHGWAQGQTINVTNGNVAGLITVIKTLNASGGGTIDLASGGTYAPTAPSDWWYGPNAFPAIASAITINGNGATISGPSGSPSFRFFFVSGGFSTLPAGKLTLNNLTLTGGYAQGGNGGTGSTLYGSGGGGGGAGMGGAIYNQGELVLTDVNLTQNTAVSGAAGGLDPNCTGFAGGGGGLGASGGNCDGVNFASGGGGGMQSAGSDGGNGGNFLATEGGNGSSGGTSAYGGPGAGSVGCWSVGGGNCQPTSGSGGGGYAPGQNGIQPQDTVDSGTGYFDPGAGGYGGGMGGIAYVSPDSYSAGDSSGGAFGGGGDGSAPGRGGRRRRG